MKKNLTKIHPLQFAESTNLPKEERSDDKNKAQKEPIQTEGVSTPAELVI